MKTKTVAKVETDGKEKELEILITTEKTNPLLKFDWMKKLGTAPDTVETVSQIHQVKEDPDITTLKTISKNSLMKTTQKRFGRKIQLREDAKVVQQKRRPIPIHLQQSVKKEREKSTKQGHIEKQIISTKTVL